MKRLLICVFVTLVFITGCQSSAKYKNVPTEEPQFSDSIQIINQEYDVDSLGREIKNYNDRKLYFSNENICCYSENNKNEDEIFYLYNYVMKKKNRIIVIKNMNLCWGNMYEKDECLYMAVGVVEKGKEKSYILRIDENTFNGELIKIKDCNTVFSSVVCSDDTVFVWYMKEYKDSTEYCLSKLEKRKLDSIHFWIYEGDSNGTGQRMSTLGTNGSELFCFVEDSEESAHMEVYDGRGEKTKEISITFSDFQKVSEEKDVFWNLYCFKDILFFETLNHRILVAKYDGKNINRIQDEKFLKSLAQNQEGEEFTIESGSCLVVASYSDKIILCGNLENRNELIIWEIDNGTIKNITFKVQDAEILSYQMLAENKVILTLFYDDAESKEFYCKLE